MILMIIIKLMIFNSVKLFDNSVFFSFKQNNFYRINWNKIEKWLFANKKKKEMNN